MVLHELLINNVGLSVGLPGERFRDTGISGFPETIFGHSSNGLMYSELIVAFLEHFVQFVEEKSIKKPVLLFVDGHSTHMSKNAAEFCAANGIVLFCLLPNATHILQPCDVGFFSPMKSAWKKNVKLWQLLNIGENLTKRNFPSVFKSAWTSVTTLEIALRGFRRSGLFPLDPSGIDATKLEPSSVANPDRPLKHVGDQEKSDMGEKTTDIFPVSTKNIVNPGPSGEGPIRAETASVYVRSNIPVVSIGKASSSYVSPAFDILAVPQPKEKKRSESINQKLPKALSGSVALKMFEEREKKKAAELLGKQKRKEELERKKRGKEEIAEKKSWKRKNGNVHKAWKQRAHQRKVEKET